MVATDLKGRDFLRLIDFTREEIETIIDVGLDLKRRHVIGELHDHILRAKTLFMLFYNMSLRTRNSNETAMTQLGGHAHFLTPSAIYIPVLEQTEELAYSSESIADVAAVLQEMGDALAIRCYEDPVGWDYNLAFKMMQEFAKWSRVPIINLEDMKYHPCQAIADIMTVKEMFHGKEQGKKFVMSWAYSAGEKPQAVPQSTITAMTMMGMDVTLAHPKGFELDPVVISQAKEYADMYGGSFEISYNMDEAFEGAHVVYPKSWTSLEFMPPKAPRNDATKAKAKELLTKNKDWICNQKRMDMTHKGKGYYMHCLPADIGMEVTDEVIHGKNSIVFKEAGNRLHSQKGLLASIMR